jgi:negative regulator of replication initiation
MGNDPTDIIRRFLRFRESDCYGQTDEQAIASFKAHEAEQARTQAVRDAIGMLDNGEFAEPSQLRDAVESARRTLEAAL